MCLASGLNVPCTHACQVSFGEFMTAIHHARHQLNDAGPGKATETSMQRQSSGEQEFALVAEKMDAMVTPFVK